MKMVVGIDTSCYTTSVAFMDEGGRLVADERRPLTVKPGGKGLAQSEMVYQHTRYLPQVFAAAVAKAGGCFELTAIAASTRPRPQPDSYMPAFLTGAGYAEVVALSHTIPFLAISHQENHILAGLWSAGGPGEQSFLAVHASGGTTEVTLVSRSITTQIDILAFSRDIAAGQFIDRIGVAIGLAFPAGPALEELARSAHAAPVELPVAVQGLALSFAGPESQARRLLAKGAAPAAVAAGVEVCVADSLTRLIAAALDATGCHDVLLVGGVLANTFIRGRIAAGLSGARLHFPQPCYSGDNAVGAAYYALTR